MNIIRRWWLNRTWTVDLPEENVPKSLLETKGVDFVMYGFGFKIYEYKTNLYRMEMIFPSKLVYIFIFYPFLLIIYIWHSLPQIILTLVVIFLLHYKGIIHISI